MRLRFFLFFLTVMGCSAAAAQQSPTAPPAVYRMSKQDFLALAGEDDSLRAVVNLYFRKRKTASTLLTVGAASLGVFVVGNIFTVLRAGSTAGDPGDELTTLAGITTVGFFGSTTAGLIRLARYPRKRLQKLVIDRKAGKTIPRRYAKRLKDSDFAAIHKRYQQ